MKRTGSTPMSEEIAAIIKLALLTRRYYQHQIASFLGVNQGRISEVKTGQEYAWVAPASELPPAFG